MAIMKRCCRCGFEKPLDCFYRKEANLLDGRTYTCIPCSNELSREYYDAHAETERPRR
jgi:hypothetical protein